ncbi:MAG TPA: DUF6701 domain-containing protein [Rhodocyclaceae bacterium]|nr:DUF6701 domain-containing protein [Rhodocyclaceae bacterium]
MNDRSMVNPGRWWAFLWMVVSVLFFFGLQSPARADITFLGASSAIGTSSPAISYRGVGAESSGVTTATPDLPTGWQPGDLHVMLVTAQADVITRIATPTGWNLVWSSSLNNEYGAVFWRIAQAGDTAPSVTSTRNRGILARVMGFYGADQTNPIDVWNYNYSTGSTLTFNSTTTWNDNEMLLISGHWAPNGHTTAYTSVGWPTWTPPGGSWNQSFFSYNNGIAYTSGGGGTYRTGLTAFYAPMATAGNTSGFNSQLIPSNNAYNYGALLAIRPALNQSITLTPPAGSAGDVLMASISVRHYQATVTPPAGWNLVQDTPQSNGAATCLNGTTQGIRTLTYYKVAGASEAPATWSYSSACDDDGFAAGGMLRFSGVDATNPIVTSAEATTPFALTHQAPAVTPGIANTMLVTVHSYGSSRSWNAGYAGVSTMSERVDQRSYGYDSALGTTLSVYTEAIPGTTSTGTRTAQGVGDADNGATHSLLLRPAQNLDHVQIEHDGAATDCVSETVTIRACQTSDCSVLYTAGVSGTVSLSGGSTNVPFTIASGAATTTAKVNASAGTQTLSGATSSPAVTTARCYNGTTQTCTMTVAACAGATCGTGTITGTVNTYYPPASIPTTVAAGSTTLALGSASGAAGNLAAGDMILIMQMQDASIDVTNGSSYGAASAVNAGKYEYAKVASVLDNTITLSAPLTNSYTAQAYSATSGQKTFQVIRVPSYSSATLGSPTAKGWDGSTGGVLAFDVSGTLTLAGGTADVSGKGFRGGGSRTLGGGAGADTDYRTSASVNNNGGKGEGIAGTPSDVYNITTNAVDPAGSEGYPNGSRARGAPANAGGGGTDGNPSANDQNTGGGGGANGGAGGQGGIAWCPTFNASSPPNYGCDPSGGLGGKVVSALAPGQLTMGGGGGGATTNNGTGSGACGTNGACSSGAAGGGIIMVRAATFSGSGTFSAKGADGSNLVGNDGSGGGGAGGAVLLFANTHTGGSVTVNIQGGAGGTNLLPPTWSSGPHGPGGGGGGGYGVTAGSISVGACNRDGGLAGNTYNNGTFFGHYGATAGSLGQCVSTLTESQVVGTALRFGPCGSPLDHYAISYPLGAPGLTCEALAVRISGHDVNHMAVAPGGSTITLSTTKTVGGWSLKTGLGAFDAANSRYTFNGSETFVEFWLTQTTPLTDIDINVTDGVKTDIRCASGCAGTEDDRAQFVNTAFRFYSDTAGTVASIGTQTAGVESATYYLRAIRTDTSTGACTGALQNQSAAIDLGYQCNDPTTCYTPGLLETAPTCGSSSGYLCFTPYNGASAQAQVPLAANDNGSTSGKASVTMYFNATGYAPFTFNFKDVGQISLLASKTLAADGTKTPPVTAATLTGSTNGFVVKPYDFLVVPCTGSTPCTTVPVDPGLTGGGGIFAKAGDPFSATVTARALGGTATPSFGRGTNNGTETVDFSYILMAPKNMCSSGTADCPATLDKTTPLYRSGFTKGIASVSDLSWSEVGVMQLKATNSTFLGNSLTTTGSSGNLGRFTPHHFGVTGTVQTRSDLLPATGSIFTYMGEPMRLTLAVTAYNANHSPSPGITQNYAGAFAKLNAADMGTGNGWFNTGCTLTTECFGLGAVNDVAAGKLGLTDRLVIETASSSGSAVPASAWLSGVGAFTVFLSVAKPTTSVPDATWGPYRILRFGALPRDSDGVTLPGVLSVSTDTAHQIDLDAAAAISKPFGNPDGTNERRLLFTTDVRLGRFYLGNAFGSEYLPLKVPADAQYWVGGGWVHNSDDSLTTLTVPTKTTGGNGGLSFPATNPRSVLVEGDVIARMGTASPVSGATSGTAKLLNGDAWLWLTGPTSASKGPGAGKYGYVDVIASKLGIPSYLNMPGNVRVCFGTCGPRSPIIYLRERY